MILTIWVVLALFAGVFIWQGVLIADLREDQAFLWRFLQEVSNDVIEIMEGSIEEGEGDGQEERP